MKPTIIAIFLLCALTPFISASSITGFALSGSHSLRSSQQTLKTDVNLVSVYFTVRDNKGKLVTTLTQDAFKVTEDGRSQTITHFAQHSDVPLNVGVLLDT